MEEDLVRQEVRFDRRNAVALDALDVVEVLEEGEEGLVAILAELAYVDAGEYNLLSAVGCRLAGADDSLADRGAAAMATGEGDSAVGAIVVAAVLHLEEGASAVVTGEGAEEVAVSGDVSADNLSVVGGQVVEDLRDEEMFLVVAEDKSDAVDVGDLTWLQLGVAAGHDDEIGGVDTSAASDHLSALTVSLFGDGASIDNIDVGGVVEADSDEAGLLDEVTAHLARLAEVELTAESMEGAASLRGGEGAEV